MTRSFQLSSGVEIPSVGLGLWKIERQETAAIVQKAIEVAYRHIDAACDYGNEAEAGVGIRQALQSELVTRDQLWITSKLWNTFHRPEHVRGACEKTLMDLGVDYLDLYHVHFPISLAYVDPGTRYPPGWFFDPEAAEPAMQEAPVPIRDTWEAMVELKRAGLVRQIGVCNFGVSLLRDLMASSMETPEVLQIELHPYLTQEKLIRFCSEHQIHVTAFSPLGAQSYFSIGMADEGESVLERAETREIGIAVDRTPAQVLLRWGVQRGTSVVPKTARVERLSENLAIDDFELSESQMQMLSDMNQNRRFNDPGDFGEKAFNTFFPIYE